MKKKIVPLVLVCAMLMSCFNFVAMATSEDDVLMPVSDGAVFEIIEGDQDPYAPITRDNYVAVDQSLTSSTGSQTVSFRTNSDYPYYRIFVSNTSGGAYNITLTNESGTNQLATSPVVLNGGNSTTLTNTNAASGMRYLTVTAKDGSALSGTVKVRLASSADELAAVAEQAGINPNDVVVTLTEVDTDGGINYINYTWEELSCTVYDSENNVVYSGPAISENPVTRGYSISEGIVKSESTTNWWPTNNENGFKCGDGIAVTVSIKTNSTASKTIGLTDGESSKSTTKNPSAILYTGTSGYWKFYVSNHSSSDFTVTGGSLSWGE